MLKAKGSIGPWPETLCTERDGISVLIDPMVGGMEDQKKRGQLRALPMIQELGKRNFTFVDTWSSYKLVDFEYLKFGDELVDSRVFPLCQFISQEIESTSDLDITEHLINAALRSKEANLLIVVDSVRFFLKNNQDGKPIIEDWDLSDLAFDYEKMFPDFLRSIGITDPCIPLTQTRNLVFHKMARLYFDRLGERPKRLSSLFDYDKIPSASYAWKILRTFANRTTELECHPYVQNCLRPWVETDVTRVVDMILEELQRCGFDPRKVENMRRKRGLEEMRQ